MPFATNPIDACRVYFEDDGGDGPPVVFLNGLGDPIAASRRWGVSAALAPDHRCIYVDQRGMGKSNKPHEPAAYATKLRVADVTAVLDALNTRRAHIIGASWGARLGFGIGAHAPERVLSLALGGQTPYAMDPRGPIVEAVTRAFATGRDMGDFLRALGVSLDADRLEHAEVLDNDFDALAAAWRGAMEEGDVASDLQQWDIPCLIYTGSDDVDFFEDARRAASEIPGARFLALNGMSHLSAHENVDQVLTAIQALIRKADVS
jgi:pimeloyl-ACP methyl ester carboxylesterase